MERKIGNKVNMITTEALHVTLIRVVPKNGEENWKQGKHDYN